MSHFRYQAGENDTSDIVIAMDTNKTHTRSSFTFKIEQNGNGTFVASIFPNNNKTEQDDEGAMYYVIVIILLYGCSILMMIASYIRKNNVDRKLHRCLKDMASVRKREQQLQLFNAAAKAAAQTRKSSCLGTEHSPDAQKWHGASHWSRANEEIQAAEVRRKSYVRRLSSVDSTEVDRSRKPSDISEIGEETYSQRQDESHHWLQSEQRLGQASGMHSSILITCEQSDPESYSEAFLVDDRDNVNGRISSHLAQNQVVMFEPMKGETSSCDERGESLVALLADDDGGCDESLVALLVDNDHRDESQMAIPVEDDDQDQDVDVRETEDSESDLFLGKSDQDSRRIKWLDFQVESSV